MHRGLNLHVRTFYISNLYTDYPEHALGNFSFLLVMVNIN